MYAPVKKFAAGTTRSPPTERSVMSAPRPTASRAQWAVGSAWARLPPDGAAYPDRQVADPGSGLGEHAVPGGDPLIGAAFDVGVPGQRADAQPAVGVRAQVAQLGQAGEVDQGRRRHPPQVELRDQALPAGQRPGAREPVQLPDRVGDVGRP